MGFLREKQQPKVSEPEVVDESLQQKGDLDWKPNTQQLMIMVVLSVCSFMVSLDATIIVTSLSVSFPFRHVTHMYIHIQVSTFKLTALTIVVYCGGPQRNHHTRNMGRDGLLTIHRRGHVIFGLIFRNLR